ncbi:MAG TPA: TIGR03086 family metal-binding protein [Streptosporangiaceae bacterium]|nr:TIGR03086 family metal-binding protein [Streptosporangiaceae bacterium]
MTWELQGYERSLDAFETTLATVGSTGWDAPSPCAGWTARDVAGHVIGGQHLIRALATGSVPPEVNTDPGRFCGDDPQAAWRAARSDCAAALTPAGLRRPVPFGALGELPLHDFLGGYILEVLIHTWDLTQATGSPIRLEPDLVHHAFATAHVIAPTLRAGGHLAPPLPTPPGADEQTRLLAFLGRPPGWTP